ncbi:MFS transporter [Sanguibacter massiliensis]|uniref:MFS transporter n=1 Tax=Sanguibacter massiliensis TaxID=1973217 RepID=UPI00101AD18E|nr:MFS transporter [Sanguibacter massiliensis]
MHDLPSSAPRQTMLVVGMVTLITAGAFESLAVATAMATIARALDGMALYSAAFALTVATSVVGMVAAGVVADRARPALPMLLGVVTFAAGLVIAAFTPSMSLLLLGRALQGLGQGAYVVALYMVVARAFAPAQRARVFAWFAAAWVVPSLVGPVVAGLVVDTIGWRWVFGAVALVAAPAAAVVLRTTWHVPGPETLPDAATTRAGVRRIGWGAVAGVGVTVVTLATERDGTAGVVVGAAGLLAALVAAHFLLPPGTLRARRGLPAVVGLRGVIAAAYFATEVMLPLILQTERGLSPTRSGTILTVAAVTWALGSQLRGRNLASSLTYLRLGTTLSIVGIAASATIALPGTPLAVGWVAWALAGLGVGMVYPTLSVLVLDVAPPAEHGAATSALQVSDALGMSLAIALTGAAVHVVVNALGIGGYLLGFGLTTLLGLVALWLAGRTTLPDGTAPTAATA